MTGDELRRARAIVDDVLARLRAGGDDAGIAQALDSVDSRDLLRVRRLIDQTLTAGPPLPITTAAGGQRFGDWLTTRVGDETVSWTLTNFIEEWGVAAEAGGAEPTIRAFAEHSGLSIATVNRRLRSFRDTFTGESSPTRIARLLRDAVNETQLWTNLDEALESTLADVPVREVDRV